MCHFFTTSFGQEVKKQNGHLRSRFRGFSSSNNTHSLWLKHRQPVKVLKSLIDRQSDIFLKFKESKEYIQLKLWYVD